METVILETKSLTKTYLRGREKALDRVSIQIPQGCVYGLLGPNGAGKSTLLKVISGMIRPDSGEVRFCQKKWTRGSIKEIGALIETPPVYPNLTARENLSVRAAAFGISEERIEEALEIAEIQNTGRKKAGQFSLGMKQRLGIAAALLNHPKLLILDEPTNGLDPIGIQKLREMLRGFTKKGITVLVSSHILDEVNKTADYIGILSGGMLKYQGGMPGKDQLEELFMKVAAGGQVMTAGGQLMEGGEA